MSIDTPPDLNSEQGSKSLQKFGVLGIMILLFAVGMILASRYLSFEYLLEKERQLKLVQESRPIFVWGFAFLIYTLFAGLALPGAAFLSLLVAWFFGFTKGVVLISLASTLGATIAFLLSRYVFRDWLEKRFAGPMTKVNNAFEREGIFYLFLLRLIPAFPFYLVNLMMGLTRIRVWTYWWVSQLGMLPATALFVYAGSLIPDLQTLKDEGVNAVFTRSQMFQFAIAFALFGLFPIVTKKIVDYRNRKKSDQAKLEESGSVG